MFEAEAVPLITVITPTFNAASCIEKCIQSVLNQTYTSVEHLIMDGRSSDETGAIVTKFQEAHPQRVRLISEQDKGIYDAMNKGVKNAKGKWLLFLGADDFLYNNDVLKEVSITLLNTKNDIVYGNAWIEKMNRIYDGIFDTEKLLKHNLCHQAVFYSSAVFTKLGFFNLNYKIEADYDFNLRCWLSGKASFQYVPTVFAFHASGGVSTEQRDSLFVKDYPALIMNYTLQSNHQLTKKIKILSIIYRKLLLRYSIKDIAKYTFKGDKFLLKSIAFLWMPFTFLLNKKNTELN